MGQEAKSARLLQMAEALKLRPMRGGELARRFGVSERTVERDLEALLELGFPVERLARGLYRIADRPPSLHPIEALALFAAGRLLYHQAPTRQYRMALDKLARMLPEPLRGLLLRSTQGLEARQGESRTLEMVARALLERRVLAFEYRSGGSKNWRPKELLVYFLEANRANLGLYAIGYERTYHRAVLTFKLSRMRHARLLDESYEIPQDFDPNAYLRRALEYVQANYGRELSIRDVASYLSISESYLAKLFKVELKITFLEYLTRVRMRRAMELMRDKNMPIYEVAERVGYRDYRHFSATFKKLAGVGPKEFQMRS